MVVVNVLLSEERNRKVGLVKSLRGLSSKQQAINYIIDNYIIDPEVVKDIIGEL